jgi:hypothetical protein
MALPIMEKASSERFLRYKAAPFWEVQRKASAVIEAPWPARIVARRPWTGGGISCSFHENVDTQFLAADLELDSWLSKIEMTSISIPI